jgi:hypothetical protein
MATVTYPTPAFPVTEPTPSPLDTCQGCGAISPDAFCAECMAEGDWDALIDAALQRGDIKEMESLSCARADANGWEHSCQFCNFGKGWNYDYELEEWY